MMIKETNVIDNAVWRRWRGQQKVRPVRRWSWPRFSAGCVIAIGLGYVASIWVSEPVWLEILAMIVGLLTVVSVFGEFVIFGVRGRTFIAGVVHAGIFMALILTNVPLKWKFAQERDEFDEVAERYEAGEKVDVPFTIGPWEIVEINKGDNNSGPVIFWESVGGAGGYGFVRHPEGHGVNTFGVVKLDDQWAWVSED